MIFIIQIGKRNMMKAKGKPGVIAKELQQLQVSIHETQKAMYDCYVEGFDPTAHERFREKRQQNQQKQSRTA